MDEGVSKQVSGDSKFGSGENEESRLNRHVMCEAFGVSLETSWQRLTELAAAASRSECPRCGDSLPRPRCKCAQYFFRSKGRTIPDPEGT